jgi:hypothetical protein
MPVSTSLVPIAQTVMLLRVSLTNNALRSMTFLLLLAGAFNAGASVRRVPLDYATVQEAFDAVNDNDTVSVSLGTYAEELSAPPFRFWLLGDVPIDTGDFPKPVIDPSSLDSAQWRRCITVPDQCELTVERMGFVNRAPMYPRTGFNAGGILVHSRLPFTARYCSFDSVYAAIGDVTWSDSLQHTAYYVIEDCRFTHALRIQVRAGSDTACVLLRRCFFQGLHLGGTLVFGGGGSVVEACVFEGDSLTGVIALNGRRWQGPVIVRNCTFGPIDTCSAPVLRVGGCPGATVEGNTFCAIRSTCYKMVSLSYDSGEAIVFRHNYLCNDALYTSEFVRGVSMVDVGHSSSAPPETAIQIDSNVFTDCIASPNALTKTVALSASAVIRANRFSNLLPHEGSVISTWSWDAFEMRYNQFEAGDYAISSEVPVDAIDNYWGDASGPYNVNHNPTGRGARVDDAVMFEPWSPDTNFLFVPRHDKPLPERFAIVASPDPFNPSTTLAFSLPQPGYVKLTAYDVTGRMVRRLTEGVLEAGEHRLLFDGSDLASGVYFVRLEMEGVQRTAKLMLVR